MSISYVPPVSKYLFQEMVEELFILQIWSAIDMFRHVSSFFGPCLSVFWGPKKSGPSLDLSPGRRSYVAASDWFCPSINNPSSSPFFFILSSLLFDWGGHALLHPYLEIRRNGIKSGCL